jgi:GTPase
MGIALALRIPIIIVVTKTDLEAPDKILKELHRMFKN